MRISRVKILIVTAITACLAFSCIGCAKGAVGAKVVGKKITEDKFKEFYYTYAATTYPPEFQRYRFYKEDGKAFFYHEKREGDKVFLTEEDITLCGTKELSKDEWATFWNFIDGGSVKNRTESTESGGSGPWLYLYWDGDKDVCQEFSFKEYETIYEFEEFCKGLVGEEPALEEMESEASDDMAEVFEEPAVEQITKDSVANLNPYIISVDRYVMDELGRRVVGYMSTNYVEIDEESGKLCPNLVKSLDAFNEGRKKSFEEYYSQFSEKANRQYEKAFETQPENADSCVDYTWIDVMRADNVALSMLTSNISYWGDADASTEYVGVSYDSQTGKQLELAEVVADFDAYKAAVESELKRKYLDAELKDVDLEKYQGWVLTPEGMILYFPEEETTLSDGKDVSIQINIDEHPGVINEKYSVAPKDYVIPFNGDDIFYMDANGDGVEREAVVFSPLGTGDFDYEEYPSYEIYVDGKPYSDFEEEYFYGYRPYYVRKNNKSYIYVYTEGREQNYISVNRFELNNPICVAKLPGTPFLVENIDDPNEDFINRHIAFTNPAMVEDRLSFDNNICGTYMGDESDNGVTNWDIINIDGKYYLDYMSEYDYMAAEIELLDETPYLVGDELRYMVRVYPFSGFAFAGEYQGAGYVMYIGRNLDSSDKEITLSEDNPFFFEKQTLKSADGLKLHKLQEESKNNQAAPEIIGSWRSITSDGDNEYNVYMHFEEDGCVDIVRKSEGYTPMVYRGIYELSADGDVYTGTIVAEAVGMGSQPVADWILKFDPKSDDPIIIRAEYEEENPIVYGADDMVFERTKSGEYDRFIHPGPWKRAEEVAEMFDEYLSAADEGFKNDYTPEYLDNIYAKARTLTNCTSYNSYGVQDNKKGGEIWIKIMKDVLPSVQVTKGWIRYDLGANSYYDIYDNCLGKE